MVRKNKQPIVLSIFLSGLLCVLYVLRGDSRAEGYVRNVRESARNFGYRPLQEQVYQKPDPHIRLTDSIPQTVRSAGLHGYNVFDNLYITGEQYMAVSSFPSKIPPKGEVISEGTTSFRTVAPEDAVDELGEVVGQIPGTTFIFNDPPGGDGYLIFHSAFITEVFVAAWKILSLAPPIGTLTHEIDLLDPHDADADDLPELAFNKVQTGALPDVPSRWMFPKSSDAATWVDDKSLNPWFLSNLAPDAAFEEEGAWRLRSMAGTPVMLQRAVIIDRHAAHAGRGLIDQWGKMNAAVAFTESRVDFFDPIRDAMISALGVELEQAEQPVIVYLDHQNEGRRLADSDHQSLIEALKSLINVAEVHVSKISKMGKKAQLALLSRATIIISVHNDALKEIMWMPATQSSTLIEIFDEGGFAPDWFLFSKLLGHRYFPIHKDHVYENPEKRIETPEFHGSGIRVDSAFVVNMVKELIFDQDIETSGESS